MGVYQDIKSKISAKLQTLTNVKYVYAYEKADLGGFPAVVILGFEVEDILEDTKSNLRNYTFKVRCFQELATLSAQTVEEVMDNLIDQIMDLFGQDFTLGGTCEGCWVKGGLAWIDREVEMRVYDLEIIAKKLINV